MLNGLRSDRIRAGREVVLRHSLSWRPCSPACVLHSAVSLGPRARRSGFAVSAPRGASGPAEPGHRPFVSRVHECVLCLVHRWTTLSSRWTAWCLRSTCTNTTKTDGGAGTHTSECRVLAMTSSWRGAGGVLFPGTRCPQEAGPGLLLLSWHILQGSVQTTEIPHAPRLPREPECSSRGFCSPPRGATLGICFGHL